MLKNLKENWLIAVISGATGSVITLFVIFICHVKMWNSNSIATWISSIGSLFGGFGAVGAVVLAYFAYKYATKQYMQNEIEKMKFEKRYNIINDLFDDMAGYYKMFIELSSLYNILIQNIKDNNHSEITSLQKNIKQGERQVLEYRYKMVMKSASAYIQLGKIEILGVGKNNINILNDCITTHNKYTINSATAKQIDITNLDIIKLTEHKEHYKQCAKKANLELTKIKDYILQKTCNIYN